MEILRDLWRKVKSLLAGRRPDLPRCKKCNDDLLLVTEVDSGFCVDCQQPALYRQQPRPFGSATVRH
jgi:hypothetical protein